MKRVLPTYAGIYHYEYRIDLDRDGRIFRLAVHYSPADKQAGTGVGAWYLDLYDAADTRLVVGLRLSVGKDKWKRFAHISGMPLAKLNVVDSNGLDVEPGPEDLGKRVLLELDLPEAS